jgi:hypothetical protein
LDPRHESRGFQGPGRHCGGNSVFHLVCQIIDPPKWAGAVRAMHDRIRCPMYFLRNIRHDRRNVPLLRCSSSHFPCMTPLGAATVRGRRDPHRSVTMCFGSFRWIPFPFPSLGSGLDRPRAPCFRLRRRLRPYSHPLNCYKLTIAGESARSFVWPNEWEALPR